MASYGFGPFSPTSIPSKPVGEKQHLLVKTANESIANSTQHLREFHTDAWRDRRKLVARSRRIDPQWRRYTLHKSWDPARRLDVQLSVGDLHVYAIVYIYIYDIFI